MLRIGLLGHGAIAAEHARAFRRAGCELTAVMGPDAGAAAEFAREHDVRRSADRLTEVVDADDVDAVVVASPSAEHAGQAIAALRAGKHVLCEIPVGLSFAEVHAVAEAAGPASVCMVGHTQRHFPVLSSLRARTRAGEFEPISLSITAALYRLENVGWTGERRSWTDDLVWHHTTHAVDTALWLLDDEAQSVQAVAGPPDAQSGRPLDLAVGLRTVGGGLATIAMSYNAITPVSEVSVFGRSETVHLSGWQHQPGTPGHSSNLLGDAVHTQAVAFLRAVQEQAGYGPTVADVLPIYRVIQQIDDQVRQQYLECKGAEA
jgi:2-hydroxy-4-carboxymuconate semialdehyde hemiacetal dehydrogenase